MQKLRLSIVLALCMLLAVSAFATDATTGVQITAADATVAEGVADVVVTVNSGEIALSGVMFSVSAPEGVTLQSWTSSVEEAVVEDDTTTATTGWYISASDNQSRFGLINLTEDATLNETVTLTYAVAAEYAEDTAEITVTAIEAIKRDESAVDVTATGATITVKSCDHTLGEWTLVEGTDATYERACECGEETETHTHTFSDWAAVEGTNTHSRACADCEVPGNTETADHDIVAVDAKDATCTEAGWAAYEYCSKCDYTTKGDEILAGHNYVKGDLVPATRETDAYYTYTCDGCGDSYTEKVATTDVEIEYYVNSLELQAEYILWYWVPRTVALNASDCWMEFVSTDVDGVATTTITEMTKDDGVDYGFMGPSIPAKNMNDKVVATMYYIQDGVKYRAVVDGKAYESNVAAYCARQIQKFASASSGSSNYKTRQILIAVLNYGSAAQVEFNYNTTPVEGDIYKGLVNLRMDEGLRKTALADFEDVKTTASRTYDDADSATNFEFYANSAELKQRIITKFYFKLLNGTTQADFADYTFVGELLDEDGNVTATYTIEGEDWGYDGDAEILLTEPAAADLCSMVRVKIYDAEGKQVSNTGYSCFEAYAAGQLAKSSVKNSNKALLKAIIAYSRAAYDKFR